MAMRSWVSRGSVTRLMDSANRGAFSRFFSDKGRVLSEEEQAKENVYIQKWERERLEKQKQQAEKTKADKGKDAAADKVQDTLLFFLSLLRIRILLNLKVLKRAEFILHTTRQDDMGDCEWRMIFWSNLVSFQWDLLAQRHQHRRYEQEITGSQMDADAMWGKSRVLRWKLMRNLWFRIEAIMTFFGIVLLGSAWAS
ncbi:hypothetical protein D0Y65_028343 [Glycine soja]|uniref:Uncharacterized protein n=2 Tax=Glycine soja TaxID=3848 RepID=A0A445ITP2_GLYSO|nr:hypothetical protein D0Y65_028343 [Glycine soja]